MKKVIKLKESDLARMVKQIMKESKYDFDYEPEIMEPDTDTKVDVPDRGRETRKNPFIMPRRNDEEDPLPDLEPQGRFRNRERMKPSFKSESMRKLRGESKGLESRINNYFKNKRK